MVCYIDFTNRNWDLHICYTKTLATLNQINSVLGTIKSSNLCTEILLNIQDKDETAGCTLASISLPSCLKYKSMENMEFIIYSKPGC